MVDRGDGKRKQKEMAKQSENDSLQSYNVLGNGTSVKGTLESKGNLRIDGQFEGTLIIAGKLVIGKDSFVQGNIQCTSAELEGRVKVEKMTVSGLLSLKATAVVEGVINTQRLYIEQGALLTGQVQRPKDRNANPKAGRAWA